MNADERGSEIIDDTLELHFGLLEVPEERDLLARRSQIVDALRHVLIAELIHTFQFEDKVAFYD
jgi:hypothetical protein